jgi:hypothetical protein
MHTSNPNTTGKQCASNGGVYQISTAWYASHYGGIYTNFVPPKGCGTVVENWFGKSGSHQYSGGAALARKGSMDTRAIYVADFDCTPIDSSSPPHSSSDPTTFRTAPSTAIPAVGDTATPAVIARVYLTTASTPFANESAVGDGTGIVAATTQATSDNGAGATDQPLQGEDETDGSIANAARTGTASPDGSSGGTTAAIVIIILLLVVLVVSMCCCWPASCCWPTWCPMQRRDSCFDSRKGRAAESTNHLPTAYMNPMHNNSEHTTTTGNRVRAPMVVSNGKEGSRAPHGKFALPPPGGLYDTTDEVTDEDARDMTIQQPASFEIVTDDDDVGGGGESVGIDASPAATEQQTTAPHDPPPAAAGTPGLNYVDATICTIAKSGGKLGLGLREADDFVGVR